MKKETANKLSSIIFNSDRESKKDLLGSQLYVKNLKSRLVDMAIHQERLDNIDRELEEIYAKPKHNTKVNEYLREAEYLETELDKLDSELEKLSEIFGSYRIVVKSKDEEKYMYTHIFITAIKIYIAFEYYRREIQTDEESKIHLEEVFIETKSSNKDIWFRIPQSLEPFYNTFYEDNLIESMLSNLDYEIALTEEIDMFGENEELDLFEEDGYGEQVENKEQTKKQGRIETVVGYMIVPNWQVEYGGIHRYENITDNENVLVKLVLVTQGERIKDWKFKEVSKPVLETKERENRLRERGYYNQPVRYKQEWERKLEIKLY